MEGTLFKTNDGSWYVITGVCGFSEVVAYEIHPDYVKGYLLQDDEEGKVVKFEIVTRLVYDALKHRSVEVPVYAILHQPRKKKEISLVDWMLDLIQNKYNPTEEDGIYLYPFLTQDEIKQAKQLEKEQQERLIDETLTAYGIIKNSEITEKNG